MTSKNSQIVFPIGTENFVIQRPSDGVRFHFETYCEDGGDALNSEKSEAKPWGFNLWMVDERREFEMSDAVFESEAAAKEWLMDNIDGWIFVAADQDEIHVAGWRFPDMEYKLPETEKWYQWKS